MSDFFGYPDEYYDDEGDQSLDIDIEAEERADLAVLKHKMEVAHSLLVRAQLRNLRDANLRQMDYNDAKERYDEQKRIVNTYKKKKQL